MAKASTTNGNFKLVDAVTVFTIAPRAITITIDDKTSAYGEPLDENYTYRVTSGSIVAGDTPQITLTKESGTDVGTYDITGVDNDINYAVTIAANGTYTITKATNAWETELTISGWTYGETGEPNAAAKVGEVVFTYSDSTDGTFTTEKPTNAGTYYVKAEVTATANHTGLTSDAVAFTIAKADYDMSGAKWNYTDAFTYDGSEKTVEVTDLPEGVTVTEYTGNTATDAGDYTASVTSFTYDRD